MFHAQLARTDAYAVGPQFSLADRVLGLSLHHWMAAPMGEPRLRSVHAYDERLSERPAFMAHGCNGQP